VNFQDGGRRHLGFFFKVEFDDSGNRGRPASTSVPNLVKISQRASELSQFMCCQNGGQTPSWILVEVKFERISVSMTSNLISVPNIVWIWAIATELWPLKWIFKMAAAAILDFFSKCNLRYLKSRPDRINLRTKFNEDIWKGGRVIAIYVFSKWRPAAMLDFGGSQIWTYFGFRDVGFSLWVKFCMNNMCNSDWVMDVYVNIQNGGRRHLVFFRKWNLTSS